MATLSERTLTPKHQMISAVLSAPRSIGGRPRAGNRATHRHYIIGPGPGPWVLGVRLSESRSTVRPEPNSCPVELLGVDESRARTGDPPLPPLELSRVAL